MPRCAAPGRFAGRAAAVPIENKGAQQDAPAGLAAAWQGYAELADNPPMFSVFTDTARAFAERLWDGPPAARVATSLEVLLLGYAPRSPQDRRT